VTAAEDFSVRVTAAAVLGKSKLTGGRQALESALGDRNPLVRAAAAAALAALGDRAAVPALEAAYAREGSEPTKARIRASIDALGRSAAGLENARFVLQFGSMRNNAAGGDALSKVLGEAAQDSARSPAGVVLADKKDTVLVKLASERHVPVLVLDGTVVEIVQKREGSTVRLTAKVEFMMRKNNSIKGTLSGAATAIDSASALDSPARMNELTMGAIRGAVESAMRGAPTGFTLASR
jgi:hypothetical protein